MEYSVMRTSQSVNLTIRSRGKSDELVLCRDVRGALVYPGIKSPGYAGIFALRNYMNEKGKFPLKLLREVSDGNPGKLFKKLFNAAQQLVCRTFYADMRKEKLDLWNLFNDYARHHAHINITLEPAPFIRNVDFGLGLVSEYVSNGGVEVGEGTLLHDQLSTLTEEDLGPEFEDSYFAVNALRYVVGSLESEPWRAPNLFPRGRSRYKNSKGWT